METKDETKKDDVIIEDKNQDTNTDKKSDKKDERSPVSFDTFMEVKNQLKSILDKQQKDEEKKLKDEGKYKELLESRDKELNDLRVKALRLEVASEKKIPSFFADRLVGSTKEELIADAERLSANLGTTNTTNTTDDKKKIIPNQPDTTTQDLDLSKLSAQEIRDLFWKPKASKK